MGLERLAEAWCVGAFMERADCVAPGLFAEGVDQDAWNEGQLSLRLGLTSSAHTHEQCCKARHPSRRSTDAQYTTILSCTRSEYNLRQGGGRGPKHVP